jgi:membrane dipeptidase
MLALASALSLLLAAPQQSAEPLVNDVEVRARAIHGRVLTLDTHKDISPLLAREAPSDPETRERFRMAYDPSVDGDQQVDFPKMRRGGLDCAFFIVYVGQRSNDAAGFARARSEVSRGRPPTSGGSTQRASSSPRSASRTATRWAKTYRWSRSSGDVVRAT